VAERGLVGVMQDLTTGSNKPETAGWLGTQLEVARRLRTDPEFAEAWGRRREAIAEASRERLEHQREIGVLRTDVDIEVLAGFLQLMYDGLVRYLATGRDDLDITRILKLVEEAVRRH
jgi:hypothetical protein